MKELKTPKVPKKFLREMKKIEEDIVNICGLSERPYFIHVGIADICLNLFNPDPEVKVIKVSAKDIKKKYQ